MSGPTSPLVWSRRQAVLQSAHRGPPMAQPGSMGLPVENEHLHSTFAMEELRSFIQAMRHDTLMSWFRRSFGEKVPQAAFLQLRSAVLAHVAPQPRIVLVHEGVQGHLAAYDRKDSTILIQRELVRSARQYNDDAW